jgi:hypothetical protein
MFSTMEREKAILELDEIRELAELAMDRLLEKLPKNHKASKALMAAVDKLAAARMWVEVDDA